MIESILKESCMEEHFFKHFNSTGHNGFLNNVSVTLIDKPDDKNPKKREDCWRRTMKTYSLYRLNVEDSVWPNPIAKTLAYGLPFCGTV